MVEKLAGFQKLVVNLVCNLKITKIIQIINMSVGEIRPSDCIHSTYCF